MSVVQAPVAIRMIRAAARRAAVVVALIAATCALPDDLHAREIVITFGGDVSANRSRLAPEPHGTRFGRRLVSWSEWTARTRPLFNGDLNFINLETIISDVPLKDARKKYTFLSHPNAVRHLAKIGVNLFSLANNHAYDYGAAGVRSTLRHMRRVRKEQGGRIWFAGNGLNDKQAVGVRIFRVGGHRIAFAAIGNLTNMNRKHRAGPRKPGTLGIRIKADWERVLEAIGRVEADFKILSCHLGVERRTQLDPGQRAKYEGALDRADVDMIIGHHPHVVRAVQRHDRKLIFYSLGNFMMRGARDMTPLKDALDYGLFGRVYLTFDVNAGRLVASAAEVIPLTQMHAVTRKLTGFEGQRRVRVLNGINRRDAGREGVKFVARKDGSAVACFDVEKGKRARRICGRRR